MTNHAISLPSGYLWLEDVASIAHVDEATLVKLCNNQIMQSLRLQGRWAIRVFNLNELSSGVIVNDLHAGGHIKIGDIINNYYSDNRAAEFGVAALKSQTPIRGKIEAARKWIYVSWYLLAGGAVFALVGLVLTWPLAAVAVIPAWINADKASMMATKHGDSALIADAKYIMNQTVTTAVVLWGTIFVLVCFIVSLSTSK